MIKVMRLWDVVFINIAAILAIRWLPIAAACGASSILLWLIAMLFFAIPLGLVSTELATAWPHQGGMYVWVSQAFGKQAGFMVSWFYWVNNFFYYPAALTFITIILISLINPDFASNKIFVCICIISFLWFSTFINMRGMQAFSKFSNLAGIFGVLLPAIILTTLGLGSVWLWHNPIATDYSLANWLPDLSLQSNLSSLSILMFSMVGIELIPTMAGNVENPQKTFPRATLVSAILIAGLYIISTMALTFVVAPEKIGAASGIVEVLNLLGQQLNLPFLLVIVGSMIVLGSLGSIGVWIVAPITMLLESCKDSNLSSWFTKTNKNGMPIRALLIQAIVVTLIVIGTAFMPSVESFFKTLVYMAVIVQFIPYIFMFLAFMVLRKKYPHINRPFRVPGNNLIGNFIAGVGLFTVILAIALTFFSLPKDLINFNDILLYYFELIFIPTILAVLGYVIYKCAAPK